MKYPKSVQEYVEILDQYADDPALAVFDIFHLYPGKLAAPDGYYDSRFFRLVAFNTKTMWKRDLGNHDSLDFDSGASVKMVRIFADKSTLVKTSGPVTILGNTQAVTVVPST